MTLLPTASDNGTVPPLNSCGCLTIRLTHGWLCEQHPLISAVGYSILSLLSIHLHSVVIVGNNADSSSRGTVLLCIFACLLLFFSHTAASTLSELDGQDALLIPHPREVYHRLRSSNPPLTIVSSFVTSIIPSSSLPYVALSYARTLLTSVMASLFPSLGNLDVDLLSSMPAQSFPSIFIPQIANNATIAPTAVLSSLCSSFLSSMLPSWLVPEVGLRSLFPFLLVVGLVLYLHHDSSYPYMLHGNRPKLPPLPDLRIPPRLGHRVGSKRGRKAECGDGGGRQ